MPSPKKKTLLLLDGNAIIHRAYHALPPLSAPDGRQTNAAYGFTSTLLNVLEKFQPDYIVASFDLPGKNFRHEMYSEYKATRKKTPDDLVGQFEIVKDVVRAFNIEIIEKAGVEADDVIGTLGVQATSQGIETVIVTGDKDTFQLVDDHVKVFTMSRGIKDMALYDAELVKDKMGVTPEQVIEYKGLRGDSSDNIPGVRGIGEKGAVDLLTKYDTLQGVYNHLDEITGAMHKKLSEGKELAFLSRELGIIKTDADVTLDVAKALSDDISFDGARKVFQELGFTSLLKRLPDHAEVQEVEEVTYVYCGSRSDIEKNAKKLASKKVSIYADEEGGVLYGFGLSCEGKYYYVAYNKSNAIALDDIFTHKDIALRIYDVKAFWHLCDRVGLTHPENVTDVLLEAYVARTGQKVEREHLFFDVLGLTFEKDASSAQLTLGLRDVEGARDTAVRHAKAVGELSEKMREEIEEIAKTQKVGVTVKELYQDVEMPTMRVLYEMERAGVAFDTKVFEEIAKVTNATLEELSQKIHDHAGEDTFNINSTKQLRVILFETLKLPTNDIKKTKTGFSTASSELEKLRELHPIIACIEQYRELFKLKTTYIDALPKLVADDGRIHSTFNQAVTSTGRLSSSDPNLQNIPTRTEAGRALRRAFVAPEGRKLISADYSQIDLRCVAHVAKDKAMTKAFNEGADIHTFTAAKVLGKDPKTLTKDERSSAKELNFGLIYGMGSFSFAKAANLSHDEAKKFIEAYFKTFQGVKKYMDDTKAQVAEDGYVETLLGRRNYVPSINSKNHMIKAAGERAAINMPIQGLTAEIMKLAMIAVDEMLTEKYSDQDVDVILQIHDEIILEAPENIAEEVAQDVRDTMAEVYALDVPLVVDTAIGNHWGEL